MCYDEKWNGIIHFQNDGNTRQFNYMSSSLNRFDFCKFCLSTFLSHLAREKDLFSLYFLIFCTSKKAPFALFHGNTILASLDLYSLNIKF